MKASVRAKTKITYHDRSGKPKLHWTQKGSAYIMVRKIGGGVKRLYLATKKAGREIKGITELRNEANWRGYLRLDARKKRSR